MAILFGFNPPFLNGPQNVFSRQEDARLVKNDILQYLRTTPGERKYRPTFGTRLRRTVFENLLPNDLAALQSDISSGLASEFPDVIVMQVTVTAVPDKLQLFVLVIVALRSDPLTQLQITTFIATAGD